MASAPRGGLGGLACAPIAFLILAATSAHAAPTSVTAGRFLKPRTEVSAKRKTALLLRKDSDPGFFRNWGVRGGVEQESMGALGNSGAEMDSQLNRNIFQGSSMAYNFNKLDNLEPIAPMDRLHAALGKDSEPGHYMNAVYVPAYLNPELFPNVHGKGCNCTMATASKPSICTCGEKGSSDHYTWLKDTPVFGTNNYTLEPADISYRSGDYWAPHTRDGLVAPADAMDPKRYPNQANGDHIWPLPVNAQKDRIGVKFARYIDQVQDRSEECDTVSKKCTVPCKPGDEVVVNLGNTIFPGKIIKAFVGNAMQIEFSPNAAKTAKQTAVCPLQAACSAFRYCLSPKVGHCVHIQDKDTTSWSGMMIRKHQCPEGSQVCQTVNQVLMATMLKKGDKTCRAAAR